MAGNWTFFAVGYYPMNITKVLKPIHFQVVPGMSAPTEIIAEVPDQLYVNTSFSTTIEPVDFYGNKRMRPGDLS